VAIDLVRRAATHCQRESRPSFGFRIRSIGDEIRQIQGACFLRSIVIVGHSDSDLLGLNFRPNYNSKSSLLIASSSIYRESFDQNLEFGGHYFEESRPFGTLFSPKMMRLTQCEREWAARIAFNSSEERPEEQLFHIEDRFDLN
jgi:uroporphyrinogen-III synthase